MIRKCTGILLTGLILGGCGKAPEPPAAPDFTPHGEEPAPTILRLFLPENSLPPGVLENFTGETGIPVEVESYASDEQMLARLLSGLGPYDLILARDSAVHSLIREHLLRPLDPARIPNQQHLAPEFRQLSFDPGNSFSVPLLAQVTGILLNPETAGESGNFADIFSNPQQSRIVLGLAPREIVSWALVSLALPLNRISAAALEQTRPLLTQWLARVKITDPDTAAALLGRDEADLAILPSSTAAALLSRAPKFRWILPEKGARLTVESLGIPVAATHVAEAESLINFLLRPEISAEISAALFRITPNAPARAILAESQKPNPATQLPTGEISRFESFLDIGDQRLLMEELVNTLKTK